MPPIVTILGDLSGEQPFAIPVLICLVTDHPLCHQPGKRLGKVKIANLAQRAGEKARIEKMQDSMFDAADILIDRQPIFGRLAAEPMGAFGVGIA